MVTAMWLIAAALWAVAGVFRLKSEVEQRRDWREYQKTREATRKIICDAIDARLESIGRSMAR